MQLRPCLFAAWVTMLHHPSLCFRPSSSPQMRRQHRIWPCHKQPTTMNQSQNQRKINLRYLQIHPMYEQQEKPIQLPDGHYHKGEPHPDPLSLCPPLAPGSQRLFLARHAQTDYNKERKLQGRGIDAELNEKGYQEAELLASVMQGIPLDIIASSSLRRAKQTAAVVSKLQSGASIMHTSGLDELSWGDFEGRCYDDEDTREAISGLMERWDRGDVDATAVKGESPNQVRWRALQAVKDIVLKGERHNLLVTHGRTLRVTMTSLLGLQLYNMRHIQRVPNTGLFVLDWDGVAFKPVTCQRPARISSKEQRDSAVEGR